MNIIVDLIIYCILLCVILQGPIGLVGAGGPPGPVGPPVRYIITINAISLNDNNAQLPVHDIIHSWTKYSYR